MVQRSFQKLIANFSTLLSGGNEQLSKKPEIAANPAEGEAEHLAGFFADPKAIRIIAQRERRKCRTPR